VSPGSLVSKRVIGRGGYEPNSSTVHLVPDQLQGRFLIGRGKVGKTGYPYTCYTHIW